MSELPALSVIIPVLNEAKSLPPLLRQLQQQKNIKLDVIVVDGGSTDDSQTIVREFGARLVETEKGRARQLNLGAQQAIYHNLLFLHADSSIEERSFLANAFQHWLGLDDDRVAGHFSLSFIQANYDHCLAFQFLAEKSATNRLHTINGDQGLMISRSFFNELGGYCDSMPVMEDQCIANNIFSRGRWILLPGRLLTSGRRFEAEGFHRRYILMGLMMGLYWTGAHQFFSRAKDVYAEQQNTEKLKLWPFFRCIWQMLYYDFGFKRSFVQWYRVGRYVRQNSWQPFFFFDVWLRRRFGLRRYPITKFHDKFFYPITNNIFFDLLITPLTFVWYMFILAPFFYLVEL